jgi:hypothetical protein
MSILNFKELIDKYHYIIPIQYNKLYSESYKDYDDYEYMMEDVYLYLKIKLNYKRQFLSKIKEDLYVIIPNKQLNFNELVKLINDIRNIPDNVFSIRKQLISSKL